MNLKKLLTYAFMVFLPLSSLHPFSYIGSLRYYEKLCFRYSDDPGECDKASSGIHIATITEHDNGILKVQFEAFAQKMVLVLQKDVSQSNATVEIYGHKNTIYTSMKKLGISSYVGLAKVEGSYDGVPILGRTIGFILRGIFEGTITLKNERYYIESAKKYCERKCEQNAVIYKGSDVNEAVFLRQDCLNKRKEHVLKIDDEDDLQNTLEGEQETAENLKRYVENPNRPRVCNIEVIIDHEYYDFQGKDKVATISKLGEYMEVVNDIFVHSDFNRDGQQDNIGISVVNYKLFETMDANDIFKHGGKNASLLLDELGEYENSHCLVVGFLHRELDADVVGTSFTASSNGGGICSRTERSSRKNTFNSVILSTVMTGKPTPDSLMIMILAHELGHSFGSPHDDKICSPRNKYLMHVYLQIGDHENHYTFSNCSLEYINSVTEQRGSKCFLEPNTTSIPSLECGNGKVDPGEECDCGSKDICQIIDHCCIPPGDHKACRVRRIKGYQCSPYQGSCCEKTCKFSREGSPCNRPFECTENPHCNGSSARCQPGETFAPDGTPCQGTFKTCVKGECESNICVNNNLNTCECVEGDDECEVCCLDRGMCQPASKLKLFVEGKKALQLVGTCCRRGSGYCDSNGTCVSPLMLECPLADTCDISNTDDEHKSSSWIIRNWLYILLVILIVVLVTGVASAAYVFRCRLKRTKDIAKCFELAE